MTPTGPSELMEFDGFCGERVEEVEEVNEE